MSAWQLVTYQTSSSFEVREFEIAAVPHAGLTVQSIDEVVEGARIVVSGMAGSRGFADGTVKFLRGVA